MIHFCEFLGDQLTSNLPCITDLMLDYRTNLALYPKFQAFFVELASSVNATGKIIESPFALILTVSEGKINRFQMLEDTFAVSRAARP
jgi:hypothetical protein